MDPATIGLMLQGAGTGLNIIGKIAEGKAAEQIAEYNAKVYEQNAILSEQQAAANEQRARVVARKAIGEMRAAYGASGVTLEGSPLDVIGESAAAAEMDALMIRHAGAVKATMFRNEAAMERYKGGVAKTLGYLGGASSLIMGGSKMVDSGLLDAGGSSGSSAKSKG
jgi:hypothetical protein